MSHLFLGYGFESLDPSRTWPTQKKGTHCELSQFATLIWGLHTSFPAKKEAAWTLQNPSAIKVSKVCPRTWPPPTESTLCACPSRHGDLHRCPRGVKHRRKPVFSGTGGPKIFLKRWEKATSRLWRWKGFWNLKKSSWKGAQYSPKKILQQEINQAKKNMFHKPVGSFCF